VAARTLKAQYLLGASSREESKSDARVVIQAAK